MTVQLGVVIRSSEGYFLHIQGSQVHASPLFQIFSKVHTQNPPSVTCDVTDGSPMQNFKPSLWLLTFYLAIFTTLSLACYP